MPSSAALASAPSRILTKNGLVSVLVMRQAEMASCATAAPDMATRASAEPARSVFMVILPDAGRSARLSPRALPARDCRGAKPIRGRPSICKSG